MIIAVGYINSLKSNIGLISAQASKEARPLTLRTTSHIKICNNPHIIFSFSTLPPIAPAQFHISDQFCGKTLGKPLVIAVLISFGYIYPQKSNICLICALASKEARPLTLCTISQSKASSNPTTPNSCSTLPPSTRLVTSFVGKPWGNPKSLQCSYHWAIYTPQNLIFASFVLGHPRRQDL